jgi:hypothetical protein
MEPYASMRCPDSSLPTSSSRAEQAFPDKMHLRRTHSIDGHTRLSAPPCALLSGPRVPAVRRPFLVLSCSLFYFTLSHKQIETLAVAQRRGKGIILVAEACNAEDDVGGSVRVARRDVHLERQTRVTRTCVVAAPHGTHCSFSYISYTCSHSRVSTVLTAVIRLHFSNLLSTVPHVELGSHLICMNAITCIHLGNRTHERRCV